MGDFFAQPGRDGRRRSDPLKSVDKSPAVAPDWQLYRIVGSPDPTVVTNEGLALNAGHYNRLRVMVEPYTNRTLTSQAGVASNPNVEIQYWSENAKEFVSPNPVIQKTGLGVGLGYTFDVEVHGGKLLVKLTNATNGSEVIAIYTQGYELDHSL